MTTHVHFVGSIGLDSSHDVFDAVGRTVKSLIRRCPDGEVGARRFWNGYQWPVLRTTPFLEIAQETAIAGSGVCPLRLKATAKPEDIHFGELGYAREARASYQDFLEAKQRGAISTGTRFQICLPTPLAVMAMVVPNDIPRIMPAYQAAMLREVQKICAALPPEQLAFQWDVCVEMIQWDGRTPYMPPFPGMAELFRAQFTQLAAVVPAAAELGFHLCYGDLDAKHFIQPADLAKSVELANLIIGCAKRKINWFHVPVPADRDDASYFVPLKQLRRTPGMEIYLGLVHEADGVAGAQKRMLAARPFIDDFGIATECGMSRSRTISTVERLLAIHAGAAQTPMQ